MPAEFGAESESEKSHIIIVMEYMRTDLGKIMLESNKIKIVEE